MKWITNGIKFNCDSYRDIAAKFDGATLNGANLDTTWFVVRAMCTQQTAKSYFQMIGKYLNAKICTVQYLYDDNGFLSGGITDDNTVTVTLVNNDLWLYSWSDNLGRYVKIAKIAVWEGVGNEEV